MLLFQGFTFEIHYRPVSESNVGLVKLSAIKSLTLIIFGRMMLTYYTNYSGKVSHEH